MRILLFAFAFLSACSVKKAPDKNATVSITGTGINVVRNLWPRGPLQAANNNSLTAKTVTDNVPKTAVTLYDLNSDKGTLAGPKLQVFYSGSGAEGEQGPGKTSPRLSDWTQGRAISWATKEFEAFMVYAHGSRALNYMQELYPRLNFKVRTTSLLPLEAYSSIEDNPLNTRYRVSTSGKRGTVLFYKDPEIDDPYNPAQESDAIYHEFGHALQHVLNPDVLETTGNYDIDMLLEALADFFAASAVRDDQVLRFLEKNAPLIFSEDNRTGTEHVRRMGTSLYFPRDYVGEYHLDGRVVSNALNDIRKFIQKTSVTIEQCSSATCAPVAWSKAKAGLSTANAWDTANFLSYEALREIVPASTIIHFSERLIDAYANHSWTAQCGNDSTCVDQLVDGVEKILISRGIYTTKTLHCSDSESCEPFVVSGTTPEISLHNSGGLYFIPLFSGQGLSNTDSKVDRCEAVMLVPQIGLRPGTTASSYDTLFEISEYGTNGVAGQVSGFTALNSIDRLTERAPFYDTNQLEIKLWGFLQPTENIISLVGNLGSRFYTSHLGSVLSPGISAYSATNPPPFGFAYRAPSTIGATGWIEFTFSTRPFEVRYATDDVYISKLLRQGITVSNTAVEFCN